MTGRTSLTASLLFAAFLADCGRLPLNPADGGFDTEGLAGAGGGAAGGAVAGAGGDGEGGAGAGGSGFGGATGTCHCSDGRCCGPDQLCELPTGACLDDGLSDGSCISPPDGCYADYLPVCGCDEITYSNDCYRRRARVPKRADGVCVGACPQLPNPGAACTTPDKICTYRLNSGCYADLTCDPQTLRWLISKPPQPPCP